MSETQVGVDFNVLSVMAESWYHACEIKDLCLLAAEPNKAEGSSVATHQMSILPSLTTTSLINNN